MRYNKATVDQDARDGIYFGRDWDDNFGFAAGRIQNNRRELIKASTSNGLQIFNAQFFYGAGVADAWTTHTANQPVTDLSTNISTICLEAVGGGGGGAGMENKPGNGGDPAKCRGGNGGNTIVRLYDGPVLKQTITARGGDGANDWAYSRPYWSQEGRDSDWGGDGSRGRGGESGRRDRIDRPQAGQPGRPGGLQALTIDLSGYALPRLQVSIGADHSLYSLRNLVERCFNKLRNARRAATRCDKTGESFLGFIGITSIRLWVRFLSA